MEFLSLGGSTQDDRLASGAAALLFSVHPLRVQSVAWVTERKDVLCGLFFILTLWLWMRSLRPGRLSGARGRTAAVGAFVLALLAKSAAVPLPIVLMIIDVWPLQRLPASPARWGENPAIWVEKAPFIVLAAVFSLVTAGAQASGGALVSLAHIQVAPLQRVNQIWMNLVFYLGKLLWPSDLTFYEWHWPPVRSAVIIGASATAALLAAAIWSRRLRPSLLAALAYQTAMLGPVLGFITFGHEIAADRYSYLSGLAWAVLFGAGVRELARRRRGASLIAACALLIALSAKTRAQITVWKDSESLWRQAMRIDPASMGARPGLAGGLVSRGRVGPAILYLEEHLRLYPQDSEIRRILDEMVAETGTTFRDHAGFHEQLGLEFAAQGEFEKAAWHFERALRYDPDSGRLREEASRARQHLRPDIPTSGIRR
jgi:hypothetical protein